MVPQVRVRSVDANLGSGRWRGSNMKHGFPVGGRVAHAIKSSDGPRCALPSQTVIFKACELSLCPANHLPSKYPQALVYRMHQPPGSHRFNADLSRVSNSFEGDQETAPLEGSVDSYRAKMFIPPGSLPHQQRHNLLCLNIDNENSAGPFSIGRKYEALSVRRPRRHALGGA